MELTPAVPELPSDWAFQRLPPGQQKEILQAALEQQVRALKRLRSQPGYWQRVNLHHAIAFFSNGFYPTALERLREASATKPPAIPHLEKDARHWDLAHLESSLRAAIQNPRRTPRGA